MATPEPPPDPTAPRVLLFGHRGAGKSALLGALLQAGELQGETLRGEVIDSTGRLPKVRDAVYRGEKLESTQTELVSFTIRLRPWRVGTQPVTEPLTVILDDCSGKAAESLLEHPDPITQREPGSPVARAVVEADAIVLLVDAASTDDELAEAFDEFDTFLTVVGRAKTDARAVGGFPIFLVLTQCDRLAQPGDTMRVWEARVHDRAEYAWKTFDAYLKDVGADDDMPSPFLPFGSVDLSVVAVAIRHPPLADAGGSHDQPYHVAELFRDCFAEAKAHHDRVGDSERRLRWTVRLALAAVAVLFLGLATFALFPPQPVPPELADRVRDYRAHEPPAAERLADRHIERNKRTLAAFAADPDFARLERELRLFVEGRMKEIDDYRAYRVTLANEPGPTATTIRNEAALQQVRQRLLTELAPPPGYAWDGTAAVLLYRKWVADAAAIEAAKAELVTKYDSHTTRAGGLMLTGTFDDGWLAEVAGLFKAAADPPHPDDAPLPGSPAVDQPRGERVTYNVPYNYDEVITSRDYWLKARDRLAHLRNLATVLGLTTGPTSPDALLVLPKPDGVDSARLPGERWARLVEMYGPTAREWAQPETFPKWQDHFSDAARKSLDAALKRSFDIGVEHIHNLLKFEDTQAGWKALAASLTRPEFRDWGRLLHLLARLRDPSASDPVAELAAFLHDLDNKKFDLDLRDFELSIPLDLTEGFDRVEPNGVFKVTVSRGGEQAVAEFTVGPGAARERATVYQLTPKGSGKLVYRPGDDLRAELPVKAGKQELTLRWETGDSNTFRFDRLGREPRLTRPTGGTRAATGVRLTPTAGTTIPKFPSIFPFPTRP